MKVLYIILVIGVFASNACADTWWNKETRNANGEFYGLKTIERPEDWDNTKNNFTLVQPPAESLGGGVYCDWDGVQWVLDPSSNQESINRKGAILKFKDSPFNNVTVEDADDYIESNVTDLDSAKEMMKKIVRFQIGMREILREQLNGM